MSWQVAVVIAIEALAVLYLGWKLWPRASSTSAKPDVKPEDLLKKRDRRV